MAHYRAEVWFQHSDPDMEDVFAESLRDFMNANRMRCQGGPVVFRIFPGGDPVPWSRIPA